MIRTNLKQYQEYQQNNTFGSKGLSPGFLVNLGLSIKAAIADQYEL
ncbi:hypothetical protein ACFSVM_09540 [Paenibacillus shunpengii]|uniref:Uncharacterized protein n=1 Tax=Paenibacillus shunpengii TaxID=2054424 RepID=A0ABW5SN46_9BACL